MNEEGITKVTRDENDFVSFRCVVSSKPASLIRIEHNNIVVKGPQTDSLELEYRQSRSTCEDAGIYRCLAENDYNENGPVFRAVQYYVRCKYGINKLKHLKL